jgi:SHS2 domain-containing protein
MRRSNRVPKLPRILLDSERLQQTMYELIHHTADIRMRVIAATQAELFSEALRGLSEVTEPKGIGGDAARAEIAIDAPDTTVLLVDFLNEVLTRSHVRRETYASATFSEITTTRLVATIAGSRVEGFGEDVKAVTYHDAEVVERDGEWSTLLVLDI